MYREEEVKYWLALKMIAGLNSREIRFLVDRFEKPEAIFEESKSALRYFLKHNEEAIECLRNFNKWDEVEKEMKRLNENKAEIVTFRDPNFPALLKNIQDGPVFLYVKGHLREDDLNIALVGSRRASSYGIITAENLARGLALAGFTIVSGMARGIDAAAHRGAISARGRTIAVLGCGLDVIYPPENRSLYEAIAQSGAVVTEYAFGTPPHARNFPFRNRLISGMSWGVVVVEASEKSGSLITARLAAEQGRTVFAVPGEINSPLSRGTHLLLKEGATLIESVEDILEDIRPQVTPTISVPKEKPVSSVNIKEAEGRLLDLIGPKPVHGDELIKETGLPAGEVMGLLLSLELKGLIQQLPGKYYRRMN